MVTMWEKEKIRVPRFLQYARHLSYRNLVYRLTHQQVLCSPKFAIMYNPLTPKSDWQIISHNSNTPESNMKVMRIHEMITN